jgi:hypothetical protein
MRKTVTTLYAEFEEALARADKAAAAIKTPRTEGDEVEFNAVIAEASDLSTRICTTPARTIDEVLLKIATAGWSAGATPPYDAWTARPGMGGGDELACLVSIRSDLEAMPRF